VADWRAITLEVVEIGAAGRSLHATMADLMALLQRHIGFDSAALAPLSAHWTVTWNKPAHFEKLWRQRGAVYVQEVASLVRVALGDAGVAQDAEVLPSRVRDRAAFYEEYMRPLGGGSFACVGLTAPGAASGLSFTRYGGGRFEDAELDLLRRLRPSLALAVRGLETEAAGGPPALTVARLTEREREFSQYVARGLTNGEIAALCGCSANTVRNRLAVVFRKLEVTTRAELAGLIASGPALTAVPVGGTIVLFAIGAGAASWVGVHRDR
jgi:DNA-binding CsgD family transcriptional regulator